MKQLYLILVLIVTACFNSSCKQQEGEEINIVIKDHCFTPAVIYASAGKKLILVVENQDDSVEEFESFDLKREKIVPANSKTRITLAPLKVGEYSFFGEFHEESCQGKLVITETNILEK